MGLVVDIRDEVYLRIAAKKAASGFSYSNDFTLTRTWLPWESLDDFSGSHPAGKVYVIGLNPGDLLGRSRSSAGLRDYSVQVGFQRVPDDPNNQSEIDAYVNFMEELEDVCRKEVNHSTFAFNRLEYLRDPEGLPLSYLGLRSELVFESYFTVFYNYVKA